MASNGQSLQTGQTFTRRIAHDTIGSDIVHPDRQRASEVLCSRTFRATMSTVHYCLAPGSLLILA